MTPDEVLLQSWRRGELAAFDALYARHERHLFGFIRRHLGEHAEAEDVLHETFLTLLREARAGVAIGSVRAFLFSVARHACLKRHRARERSAVALSLEATSQPPSDAGPHDALEQRQVVNSLHAALERLPPALTELYHLRASGLSYEEVARVLSIPLGTVKSRMHELVSRLQEEMPR